MLAIEVVGAFGLVAVASAFLTGLVYRHAVRKRWLAIPNTRSSHRIPTPSSGGLGLTTVTLGTLVVLGITGALSAPLALALVGGGAIVAIVGWIDDRQQLPARVRFIAHTVAAVWAIGFVGGPDTLAVGAAVIPLGVWGTVLAILAVIAFSNLYNFMDGIDGLIGSEAVLAGSVLAILSFAAGAPMIAASYGILAAAVLGFLMWNWHPAKLFMGDVGSVFLGFCFAVLAVASEQLHAIPALSWMTIFAVVIVDAGFTTIRRALRGERWYEAHRTFAYQRAVQGGHRHSTVVLGMLALDVILVAFAITGMQRPTFLLPTFVTALLLVTAVWAYYQFVVSRRAARVMEGVASASAYPHIREESANP